MLWHEEPPQLIVCAHGAEWFLLSPRERTEVRGKGFLAFPTVFEPLPADSPLYFAPAAVTVWY